MKRCIALGGFLVLTAVPALARAQGSAADEAAIRDVVKQYNTAWSAGDAAKVAALYADDGTLVDEQGMEITGRPAIEKNEALGISEMKGIKLVATADTIRSIRPDVVLVKGTTNITGGELPPEGGKAHWLCVLAKQGGSWKIQALHVGVPPPPPQK